MISSLPRLISEARASACVSIYSRMFVSLPFRTVMAKAQWSSNVLFVALILPVAYPEATTRSPCAMNSGGSGYEVSTVSLAFCSTSANPACPRCVPASGQFWPGMIHSIFSADNASKPFLSRRPSAARKSFTVWTFSCVLIEISPFPLHRIAPVEICDHDSSVELDQVLKDQLTPAISARLHKQSTFRKPAKFDRRETEIFRKRTNLRCGAVIVARQEHDSPATVYGRILVKDGSDQMIEALGQSCASEGLRDELGGRLSPQFLRGHAVGIGHIDDGLSLPGP